MKKIARTVALAVAGLIALPAAAETPDYLVEWVQPSAALYVDTGVKGKCGVKAEVKFSNINTDRWPVMLGSWNDKRFNLVMHDYQNARWEYGYAMVNWGNFPYYGSLVTAEVEVSASGAMTGMWTNQSGETISRTMDETANYGAVDTDLNLYLFASHYKSGNTENAAQCHLGRLYRAKLWTGDTDSWTPARDFIPCVKDGVAGLYDAVSGTIFYPQGNTLVAGPAKNDSGYAVGSVTHPATQWGRISYGNRGGMGDATWRLFNPGEYTPMGAGDIDNLLNSSWRDANLRWSQDRFDGWFQVTAEKAGTWAIRQKFDDYFAIFIDNDLVLYNNSYTGEANSTVEVSEGWHRFTIIAGDTYGGYGPSLSFNGGWVPFTVTVNGTAYAFNATNFPQGSGSNSYTLTANEDWTDRGPILLAGGAVLDLNGHILTVKDIACDEFVGAYVTNSASKKSVLVFKGDPSSSKAIIDGLVKGAGVNIFLVQEGTVSATTALWTGDAGDGNALNSANWVNALTMDNIVPDATYDAVFRDGVNVDLQIPSGSAFACKSIDIGNCTFTADCDWRGLSVTPTISGAANLNGHKLTLNNLSASSGAAVSGGEGSAVVFAVPDASQATFDESLFVAGLANLTLSGDAKILLSKEGGGTMSASSALNVGTTAGRPVEFKQANGDVSVAVGGISTVAGGNAVYTMAGGTLTASSAFEVGGRGTGVFTQTGGTTTLNNWLNLGRYGGTGTVNMSGGRLVNALNNIVYLGCEGGTGIVNVGGDGYMEVHQLALGGGWSGAHKGYLNISGNGHFKTRQWVALANMQSSAQNSYGEINQSGGTFEVGTAITIGENNTGTGVYNLTDGTLKANDLVQLGWHDGSTGRMTMDGGNLTVGNALWVGREGHGTFVQNGGNVISLNSDVKVGDGGTGTGVYTFNNGTIRPKYWFQIGWYGTGRFVQNGGDAILTGQNNNWVCLGESNGNATYEMNGGYLEAQNGVYLSHNGAASAMFIMKGGTVVVPTFVEGTSAANSTLVLGGGTIKAAADGATIFNSIDNIIYSGDFTLDTNGKNAGISGTGSETALSGSKFTKAGEGTLTAAAIPAASTVKVAAGTLALSSGGDNTAARMESLAHRWSFNDGTLADSVTGSAEGTRNVGDNEISGGMLHLPGGNKNTKHVDLGANKVATDSATLEFWFTPRANTVWPKMFCLGANSGNVVAFTTFRTSNGGPSGIDVGPNGGTFLDTNTRTLSVGVKYHLAVVFDYNGETGATALRAYCFDTSTGLLALNIEQTLENWRFTDKITQNYFCLGYSFWNDGDANIDYDEVRVWNKALTRTEVERNLATGPDAAFETGDTVRKIELASGGTLDLGGNTLRQPSLVLGGGTVRNGTLVVTGTIDLHVGDSIVNAGTIDLSGATINLVDPENLDGTYTFISGSGTVTGKPAAVNVPNGWTVGVAGGKACIRKTGIAVIVW